MATSNNLLLELKTKLDEFKSKEKPLTFDEALLKENPFNKIPFAQIQILKTDFDLRPENEKYFSIDLKGAEIHISDEINIIEKKDSAATNEQQQVLKIINAKTIFNIGNQSETAPTKQSETAPTKQSETEPAKLSRIDTYFTVGKSIDNQPDLEFIMVVYLRENVTLEKIYPSLNVYPFNKSSDQKGNIFIYWSKSEIVAENEQIKLKTIKPWQSPDILKEEKINIVPGLNFASSMKLKVFSGALQLISDVLQSPKSDSEFIFYGPFYKIEGEAFPVTFLRSEIKLGEITILGKTFKFAKAFITMSSSAPSTITGEQILGLGFLLETETMELHATTSALFKRLDFFGKFKSIAINPETLANNLPFKLAKEDYDNYLALGPKGFTSIINVQSFGFSVIYESKTSIKVPKAYIIIGSDPQLSWPIIDNVLILKNIYLSIEITPSSEPINVKIIFKATAEIYPAIFKNGNFFVDVKFSRDKSGWNLSSISGAYNGQVRLGDIIDGFASDGDVESISAKNFSENCPDYIKDIIFSNCSLEYSSGSDSKYYRIYTQAELNLQILDSELESRIQLSLKITQAKNNPKKTAIEVEITGDFLISGQIFNFTFKVGGGEGKKTFLLEGHWEAVGADNYLQLSDVVELFGFESIDVPENLDLSLRSGDLSIDFGNSQFYFLLNSKNYGKLTFVAAREDEAWRLFFGLNFGKFAERAIDISAMPLLGDFIDPDTKVSVDHIQFTGATGELGPISTEEINRKIGRINEKDKDDTYPLIPDQMKKGVGLALDLTLGQQKINIVLNSGKKKAKPKIPDNKITRERRHLVNDSAEGEAQNTNKEITQSSNNIEPSDNATWVNLEKKIGPLYIQKIGFEYKDQNIYVYANLSLTAGGMSISVIGFGVGININDLQSNKFKPHFQIRGLSLSYSSGGVTISGGLLGKVDPPPVNFVGQLSIKMGKFGVSAFAGYTTDKNDNASLFAYVLINAPLGGPPFFFITGIAGGFGYNRDLIVPAVEDVATFPFVQWAQGKERPNADDPVDILNQLNSILPPKTGQYWLAAGVQFTSFEFVKSFVLAIVKFGNELQIDLLGTTILTLPPRPPGTPDTVPIIVFAELQLLATFKPSNGFIGISGQLTAASFILSKDCHITGGFAFYMWFLGPYGGDFVITLGGYDSTFNVPSHYPKVPRLGLSWKITEQLSIQGELYFAITSSKIMLGGGVTAIWTSDKLRARFYMQMAFLMDFQPLHYQMKANVGFNIAYDIETFCTKQTIEVTVAALLEIWGPDFSGIAKLTVGPLIFEIQFGDAKKDKKIAISWKEFVEGMLKISSKEEKIALNARKKIIEDKEKSSSSEEKKQLEKEKQEILDKQNSLENGDGIYIEVPTGLIKQYKPEPGKISFVLHIAKLEIAVKTAIPVKAAKINGENAQISDLQKEFGVSPARIKRENFQTELVLKISKKGGNEEKWGYQQILSNVPKALWKSPVDKIAQPSSLTPPDNPLIDTTIKGIVSGYTITPPLAKEESPPLKMELAYTLSKNKAVAWGNAHIPGHSDLSPCNIIADITAPLVQENRKSLLEEIQVLIKTIDEDSDINKDRLNLFSWPTCRYLGAIIQGKNR